MDEYTTKSPEFQQQWRDVLLQEAQAAVEKGELTAFDEPAQIAFELGVILAGTDIIAILHDDPGAVSRGRAAVASRLKGSPI